MMKCVVGVRYINNIIFFIEDFIDKNGIYILLFFNYIFKYSLI